MPLNRADTDFERDLKATTRAYAASAIGASSNLGDHAPCRELTVAELIDGRIERADRLAKQLRLLRDQLSGDFLRAPASRISALLER